MAKKKSFRDMAVAAKKTKYQMEPGFKLRDQVAKEMGCSVHNVNDLLRPAIEAGEVVRKEFRLYNEKTDQVVRKTAYKII